MTIRHGFFRSDRGGNGGLINRLTGPTLISARENSVHWLPVLCTALHLLFGYNTELKMITKIRKVDVMANLELASLPLCASTGSS